MSDRNQEILSTLKRSTKNFSADDIISFARYVTSLKEDDARLKLARTTGTPGLNGFRPPKLPRGIKADLAKKSLLKMLQIDNKALFVRFAPDDKKSYTAICKAIHSFEHGINLKEFVDKALDKYSGTYSSSWTDKPRT